MASDQIHTEIDDGNMRIFESGAVRDTSTNKLDYEACLSPLVLKRYAEYIRDCRVQPDGNLRADDNWQKGFGLAVWMKSKLRHILHTWTLHRTGAPNLVDEDGKVWDIETALCAEFFNTHGMLHEVLANKHKQTASEFVPECVFCGQEVGLAEGKCSGCGYVRR